MAWLARGRYSGAPTRRGFSACRWPGRLKDWCHGEYSRLGGNDRRIGKSNGNGMCERNTTLLLAGVGLPCLEP
jgi:hypothetical protein